VNNLTTAYIENYNGYGNGSLPAEGSYNASWNGITATTGSSPVPEPTTIISGAMLLLPFGVGAVRFFRKQRAA
jgi:hypothetical protein